MDYCSASTSNLPGPIIRPKPPAVAAAPDLAQPQPRDRRRQKPWLSCLFCRSRKVRCDRQLPCETCTSKGIGLSCTYAPKPPRQTKVSVRDRIQQLEALVRSLAQQQQTATTPGAQQQVGPVTDPSPRFLATPGSSSPEADAHSGALLDEDDEVPLPGLTQAFNLSSCDKERPPAAIPTPSEPGSLRTHSHGAGYVGSVHWAAVLDSISELREYYEEEEAARMLHVSPPGNGDTSSLLSLSAAHHYTPGPRLLYEPLQLTKADVLASVPARPVVDRMVARYFNAQGIVPEVLHRGRFLREYEKFWQDPTITPFIWLGLLFSIMCISTQLQESTEDLPQISVQEHVFRERTVHCLILGHYTRGGDYVLETMINYLSGEALLSKDADIGLWLVQGILVQLALSKGYHRDPQNFSHITPFAGEMRRRVWAMIVQVDLRLASQIGLPRLLKTQQHDTASPRNLFDTDFDEDTAELPPSRPETEVTPMLYSLARDRVDRLNELVSDLVNDTTRAEPPYVEITALHRRIHETEASLPAIFRWQPLSQAVLVPPPVVMHRVFLQLGLLRVTIWLHRRYLGPAYSTQPQYRASRKACVRAAVRILELQRLVSEETRRDGLLHAVPWLAASSRVQAVFLLGMSVLCYHLQLGARKKSSRAGGGDLRDEEVEREEADGEETEETDERIRGLLRDTYPLWLRSSVVSLEARQAVEHLRVVLGLNRSRGGQNEREGDGQLAGVSSAVTSADTISTPPLGTPRDSDETMSFDQTTWDAYQECIAKMHSTATPFSSAESLDLLAPGAPRPSWEADEFSMADLLLTNADSIEQDTWM